jgi:hypothetical protein
MVEKTIEEMMRDVEAGLAGPNAAARLYNAETIAAEARAAQPTPIRGEDDEPYLAHVYGYAKAAGGFTRFPMGEGGAKPFLSTGFAYSALSQVLGEVAQWGQRAVIVERINELRYGLDTMLASGFEIATSQVAGGEMGNVTALRADLKRLYDGFLDNWQKGVVSGDGASFSSYMEQMAGTGQAFSAYKNLMFQASVVPRMRRYWMASYSPTVPDERMAWTMFRRGILKEDDFTRYCQFEGWEPKKVEWLKGAFKAIPNENAAFRMFARGKITWQQLEKAYYANSWEKEDFDKLNGLYEWLPNAREGFALFKRGHIKEDKMHGFFSSQGYMKDSWDYLPKMWERLPTPRDAFEMMMRGAIKQEDFDKYVEANEWEDGSAERLVSIFQNLPGAKQAFTLFKRGVLKKDAMTTLMQADGFMPVWQKALPSLFERIPHPKDAFNAFMRGKIDKKAFDKWVVANEWYEGGSDFLYDIYTRLPSIREAFYMWAKGIIDTNQRDQLYLAAGYDKEWHSKLTENEYYIPTVYDLTRIADFVEIDSIWATKILKERGVRDRDITKILAMLKIRPLRDEIRRQIALWVYRYRMGWASAVELEAALQAYLDGGFIQSTEKDFTVQEAELNYEDELMYEKIQIYSWYFKTAVISEEELLQDFLDLGIREEKANLMVEGLKAQGYYGYY